MSEHTVDPDASEVQRVTAEAARAFTAALLIAESVQGEDAASIADCLVRADLRGVDTHGVVRLPGYVERVRHGLVNPHPDLSPRQITPVVMHLDGQDGFGFVLATRAIKEATAMARTYGIGLVAVRRSTHFGMAAAYLLQAMEAGYAALVFTNASRAMPPWGGRDALLGTSPFAAGFPGGTEGDFLLDMAPSVAARGKIRRAAREGRPIPEGYALDAEGRPTTDPDAALQGVVLPIGGAKGSGLSMLMDVLAGVFTGAAFAGDVGDQYKDFERPQNVGHFFLALKPELFVEDVRDRMDLLSRRVHGAPRAEGFDEVMMPGEIEAREEARRLVDGIPYRTADLAPLNALAAEHGLPPLGVAA